MKTSIITATIGALATLGFANPVDVEKRVFDVSITFYGANGENFTQLFPADTSSVQITNPLVVNRITSPGGGFCTLTGVEGTSVVIFAEDDEPVDPPQRMKWGSCDNN